VVEEIEGKVDRGLGRLGARGRLWGGGVWPERRTAAALRSSLDPSSSRGRRGKNGDGTVRIRTRSSEGEDRRFGDAWSRRRRRGVAAWERLYGHRKEQGSIVPTFEKF